MQRPAARRDLASRQRRDDLACDPVGRHGPRADPAAIRLDQQAGGILVKRLFAAGAERAVLQIVSLCVQCVALGRIAVGGSDDLVAFLRRKVGVLGAFRENCAPIFLPRSLPPRARGVIQQESLHRLKFCGEIGGGRHQRHLSANFVRLTLDG